MEHYKVLTGTDKDVLSRDVCSMLADGWYLVGVLEVIVQDGVLRYIQAMAKDAHNPVKMPAWQGSSLYDAFYG